MDGGEIKQTNMTRASDAPCRGVGLKCCPANEQSRDARLGISNPIGQGKEAKELIAQTSDICVTFDERHHLNNIVPSFLLEFSPGSNFRILTRIAQTAWKFNSPLIDHRTVLLDEHKRAVHSHRKNLHIIRLPKRVEFVDRGCIPCD